MLVVLGTAPWLIAQSETRRVWDGVFTKEQAGRGLEAYTRACTYCHRADLSGNEDGAPALRGPAFFRRWTDRPLSELYFVVKETMPQDDPASLTAAEYVDIISFILQRNDASPGDAPLPADEETLSRIKFTPAPSP